MVLVLSEETVRTHLDLPGLVDVVGDALAKQAAGDVERPDRPHFPVGTGLAGDEPTGTAITMPAYIHGEKQYATKLVGVHEGNADRGYPTIHAQIALTDAQTGRPKAYMAGTTITKARTGCVGALAVRELAPETTTLGIIGAGAQARWQTRAIATVSALDDVRIYSPSDSRIECADDLMSEGIQARAVDTPEAAITSADAVVTTTTATEPVFPADALDPDTLVVAVGAFTAEMQELPPAVLNSSTAVFADVPSEAAKTGDVLASDLGVDDLLPFGDLVSGRHSPSNAAGTPVVVSVGSATLDAAAGAAIYRRAVKVGDGTTTPL
jgi:alanine dehydrogenase